MNEMLQRKLIENNMFWDAAMNTLANCPESEEPSLRAYINRLNADRDWIMQQQL
jgi:hypothetical protein